MEGKDQDSSSWLLILDWSCIPAMVPSNLICSQASCSHLEPSVCSVAEKDLAWGDDTLGLGTVLDLLLLAGTLEALWAWASTESLEGQGSALR